jgi:hypothetical protein
MAAVIYWRLPELAPVDPGPLPWLPGIPETLHDHPSGGPTWQSDPSLSPISPTRSKITSAKVTARRPGLQQEVIPPHLFAKSQYGEPPTASIPKIRDQPAEEASLIQPPPSGNSDSTGISPVPPIRQATRGLRNDRQRTPQ